MRLEEQQIGRYYFRRFIETGGTGTVYLAEDPRIQQQVAIKVIQVGDLTFSPVDQGNNLARFRQEAAAIANLNHPHIVHLNDYNEAEVAGTKIIYIVYPFYKAGSLANWLRGRDFSSLSLQDVADIVRQAADALQYTHQHHIIHQDVKPSNFLIDNEENPKRPNLLLTDFGISKFSDAATYAETSPSLGTLTYMAPEQINGRPTYASDQYALAVMTYELLTGRPPFQGPPQVVMNQHFNAQPQPPSALNPGIPKAIDSVILRALAKRPEDRFDSVAAFANAFQQGLQRSDAFPQTPPRGKDIPALPQGIAPMGATLTGSSGQTPLGATILVVGRAPNNQLVINDPQISGHHAEIRPEGQGYTIVDLGSTNGTFVNDYRLPPNTPRSLHPGDRIRFGKNSVFTYGVSGVPQVDRTVLGFPAQGDPTLRSSAGAQQGYPPLQPTQDASPLPKRRRLTLGNISIGGGIGIIVAVIGLLLQLGVIHPYSPKVIPTATPNLSPFSDAQMSCRSNNTIDPKTLWSSDGLQSTTYNCNATGLVITQKPKADTIASVGLSLPLPHESLPQNYSISVQISNLAPPQSCAGVVFRHSGYRAYFAEICLNGTWSVGKSFATNGVTESINHGTYTVNQKNSYLFLVEVSNAVATISIDGQGIPSVTLDPTFTDKIIDLFVDGDDPLVAGLDPSNNPGASATFSQFIFQPLG